MNDTRIWKLAFVVTMAVLIVVCMQAFQWRIALAEAGSEKTIVLKFGGHAEPDLPPAPLLTSEGNVAALENR